MEVLHSVSEIEEKIYPKLKGNKKLGLVPTMGALHDGHAELVKRCVVENDISVVSVFVNPTQFNNPDDLDHYPRTPEKDFELLAQLGVHYVFAPTVEEMYPEPDTRLFDFGHLDKVMEGKYRPGHFNGVAQVVSKLFFMVKPDRAYFGEKDFQQLAIVKDMVKQLKLNVEIVPVPIVREQSGLALSSRNQRLSEEEKKNASKIYEKLKESLSFINIKTPSQTVKYVTDQINNVEGLSVEYFSIVDADSLLQLSSWNDSDSVVGCIAVYCGDVRLIDNIRYK